MTSIVQFGIIMFLVLDLKTFLRLIPPTSTYFIAQLDLDVLTFPLLELPNYPFSPGQLLWIFRCDISILEVGDSFNVTDDFEGLAIGEVLPQRLVWIVSTIEKVVVNEPAKPHRGDCFPHDG
jgi:hypothetical protein